MHHTGSQENEVEPEEQEKTPEQEIPGGPEPKGDLQECPNHPSTFERGKPQSILSLPIPANLLLLYHDVYYAALSDRSCFILLMHIYSLNSPPIYLPCPK